MVAGPHVRNACRRHLQDLTDGPARGLRWDLTAALRIINFCPDVLRLNGGQFEGKPFVLHPSQAFTLGSLFGWKRRDGTRRFRRAYIEQGKGNGKTPMAAACGMYCLLADGEERAEIYAAGKDKDQAMVLFRDAVAMRQQSPALAARLVPSGGNPIWNLADLRTGSFFRPISKEMAKSGPRPYVALCDELHEHPNGDVVSMLERGFKFRRQPLLMMITNSGSDRHTVCYEEHQHAVRCAAGTRDPDGAATYVGEVIDDTSFSFVCALDEGDDPLNDPTCWPKANPLLDVTITTEYLAGVAAQAKALPGKLNNILRLHFCQWTDAHTSWMSRPTLEACLADFNPADYAGAPVWVGLDLSATRDLTAAAYCTPTGPDAEGRPTYAAWVEAWTPGDTLAERTLADAVPYDVWVAQGWLQAPPGKMVRLDYVAASLAEAGLLFDLQALAYDSYGFARHFEPELDNAGVQVEQVAHPQGGQKKGSTGLWMPGSKMMLEELLLQQRIRLRRSPVLIAAMMAAAVEQDPWGNAWFAKRKSTARIDPLIALAMAVGAATNAPVQAKSFWQAA